MNYRHAFEIQGKVGGKGGKLLYACNRTYTGGGGGGVDDINPETCMTSL